MTAIAPCDGTCLVNRHTGIPLACPPFSDMLEADDFLAWVAREHPQVDLSMCSEFMLAGLASLFSRRPVVEVVVEGLRLHEGSMTA